MAETFQIEHLLRRTEYVARPQRVAALTPLSLSAAVDDIMNVPANPGTASLTQPGDWDRSVQYTAYWLDRMAHDAPRPLQEKMAFFWHGHFCSDLYKVERADLLCDQVDLFRTAGLTDLRNLAVSMSKQPAMLRYLDNNRNQRSSPNQNFARELMELFLLGVGNYTEADVEASTAAWTGHTETNGAYQWAAGWHDATVKQYLGRTINQGADHTYHGPETIDVVLGDGVVPNAANVAGNRNRPTKHVAAEFISRKLWAEFAGTAIPDDVLAHLRDTAVANNFAIKPWLKALLTHPGFYSNEVRTGRVRTPIEFYVAGLYGTGQRAESGAIWLLDGMGQRPFFPPNVAGWKHNDVFVNASAMSKRTDQARRFMWIAMAGFWDGDGLLRLGGGTIHRDEFSGYYHDRPAELVDRLLQLLRTSVSGSTRQILIEYAAGAPWWERLSLVHLILMSPDFQLT
jgi:uncharacterized protein (DUF1800 family)